MYASFENWTGNRSVATIGTNAGSISIPFQKWRHFKEAFTPELILRAVQNSNIPVNSCLDPFGGSGTTALACQFLGIKPTTMEVNPYLADLTEAKLSSYDSDSLVKSLGHILRSSDQQDELETYLSNLPPTFVEPGLNGRWLFDMPVARRLVSLALTIRALPDETERRLFRVLLGGIMLSVSNVLVNGKGRRYRRGWHGRRRSAVEVDVAFADASTAAIAEIDRFSSRREPQYRVIRGDCRTSIAGNGPFDLAVFSPPYPNSFDYTDVYNIELWMLNYIRSSEENKLLRRATLTSHVQAHRAFPVHPMGSPTLCETMEALRDARNSLWDRRIPEMVGAYFSDMATVMSHVYASLVPGGSIWMVVGDSRYANVSVRTADVLCEFAPTFGLEIVQSETLRDMRASAQQGGQPQLAESLLIMRRS